MIPRIDIYVTPEDSKCNWIGIEVDGDAVWTGSLTEEELREFAAELRMAAEELHFVDCPRLVPDTEPSAQVTRDDLLAITHEIFMAVRLAMRMQDYGRDPQEALTKAADRCESILSRALVQQEGE